MDAEIYKLLARADQEKSKTNKIELFSAAVE
jgi:hypothetical protein